MKARLERNPSKTVVKQDESPIGEKIQQTGSSYDDEGPILEKSQ